MEKPAGRFRVIVRMVIRSGVNDEFEKVWLDVAGTIAGNPGNHGQWLCQDAVDPAVYYVVSDWTDARRFAEFETSAAHVVNRKRLQPFRTGGDMNTMRVVAQLRGTDER